jgi:GNAT superfamily N-acetyltransferase
MVKRLDSEYLEDACALIQDVIRGMKAQGIDQWDEVYPNKDRIQSDIENAEAFGYFEKEHLIGYMVLNETFSPEYLTVPWMNTKSALIVHRLCVAQKKQGKGIAKQLMKFGEEYAFSRGYASIKLDAFVFNLPANALYVRLNYQHMGVVKFRKGLFNCYEKLLVK